MRQPRSLARLGATLIEVSVVATVFFVILAAVWSVYMTSVRLQKQVVLKSDIDRILLAGVRHVDAALAQSRVMKPIRVDQWNEPEPSKELELKPFRVNPDGSAVITAEGYPEWGTPYLITFDEPTGELYRHGGTVTRRALARLGAESDVTFLRPGKAQLRMSVEIQVEGEQGYRTQRQVSYQFRLFNQ